MYFNIEDICLNIFKCLIWAIFILFIFYVNIFNYEVGISFCEIMNIPKDFSLTMISPGMALNVTIVMFVIEMIILFYIIKNIRKIRFANKIFEFLCDINI